MSYEDYSRIVEISRVKRRNEEEHWERKALEIRESYCNEQHTVSLEFDVIIVGGDVQRTIAKFKPGTNSVEVDKEGAVVLK